MAHGWGKVWTVTDFIFLGSKITVHSDCRHAIKRCLLLGRKAMTNLDSILKSRDIILPTKVHTVNTMLFPVVMYGCESWTIKKAEHRRIGAFDLWCCRRLLRVPWTARRPKQSILKEINPKYSLEGLVLKLQYFSHWYEELTHWKSPWCWERLRVGEGGDREWDGLDGITDSMKMSLRKFWEIVKDWEAWCTAVHGVTKNQTQFSNWKITTQYI